MKTKLAVIGRKTPSATCNSPVSPPLPAPTNIYRLGGLWETYMFKTKPWSSYERYGRALSRFLEAFPGRRDINSFVRPEIIDWVNARLAEGASVATVRTELAAIRSFFQFCVDMQVAMLNPARGVKVPNSKKSQLANASTAAIISPCERHDDSLDGDPALAIVLVAYTTFFGCTLLCDLVSSSTAPASVANVSVPADAVVAAVATIVTFAVVALTSNIKSGYR